MSVARVFDWCCGAQDCLAQPISSKCALGECTQLFFYQVLVALDELPVLSAVGDGAG
jgi:hypothetical protein